MCKYTDFTDRTYHVACYLTLLKLLSDATGNRKNMRSAKKFPPFGRTFRTNVIVTFVNIMTCNVPPMNVFLSMNQLMKEKNKSINNKTTNKNGKAI